jgi:hypothetical protein
MKRARERCGHCRLPLAARKSAGTCCDGTILHPSRCLHCEPRHAGECDCDIGHEEEHIGVNSFCNARLVGVALRLPSH